VLLFNNEIKPGVKNVVRVFDHYGLDLKILTGDSEIISHKTGEDLLLKNVETTS
jgi:cation transport ATPase